MNIQSSRTPTSTSHISPHVSHFNELLINIKNLEKRIGISFNNEKLLKTALTHRSYLNETSKELESNERLEFLGDAVLELIASDYLFKNYPNKTEGKLTSFRSSIVNTKSLAIAARKINLGNYLFLSKGEEAGGGRSNNSLLADTFEALLGAIYLDKGLERAGKLVEKLLIPLLPNIIKTKAYIDYKSKLQALIQEQMRITPTYGVEKEIGPDHNKTFYVRCVAGSQVLGKGSGKSKQEAEQNAAKNALEKTQQ